jgi:hypothetical protein
VTAPGVQPGANEITHGRPPLPAMGNSTSAEQGDSGQHSPRLQPPSYAATFEAGSVGSVTGTWRELVLAASLATRAITSSRSKKISASMASSLVVPLQL